MISVVARVMKGGCWGGAHGLCLGMHLLICLGRRAGLGVREIWWFFSLRLGSMLRYSAPRALLA